MKPDRMCGSVAEDTDNSPIGILRTKMKEKEIRVNRCKARIKEAEEEIKAETATLENETRDLKEFQDAIAKLEA